jgi:hypothetical protein
MIRLSVGRKDLLWQLATLIRKNLITFQMGVDPLYLFSNHLKRKVNLGLGLNRLRLNRLGGSAKKTRLGRPASWGVEVGLLVTRFG